MELVMFYNVENLFPPDGKFLKGNSERKELSSGLNKWNEGRYQDKLQKIGNVFRWVKEEKKQLPMIIGLAEIAHNSVLEDLLSQPIFENKYSFVHYDSLDDRGVDTALLYDKTKIDYIDSEPISFIFQFADDTKNIVDTTRDVLQCKLKYKNKFLNVFVLHLPSKKEQEANQSKRDYILNAVKERVQSLIKENEEAVMILGDFNENPYAENINFLLYKDGSERLLKNPFIQLYKQRKFSTFYLKQGLLFDQILLSGDFYLQNFPLKFQHAEVFSHHQITLSNENYQGKPFRTYAGTRYLGGYSDHFPVLVELLNV